MNDKMVEALLAPSSVEHIPGNVGVSRHAEFRRPPMDRGPFWARAAERIGELLGSAAGALLSYFIDRVDEAVEEEEQALAERERVSEIQLKRVEELWQLVWLPEVAMPVRLDALGQIAQIEVTPLVEGWFGELIDESNLASQGLTLRG